MGTRNSTLIKVNGEYKVAQYGQWDGMPDSLGKNILKVLRTADLVALKNRVSALKHGAVADSNPEWKTYLALSRKHDEEQSNALGNKALKDDARYEAYHKLRESHRNIMLKTPSFRWSRDCGGANIIKMLLDPELKFKTVAVFTKFVADSLFCEWAYVIDLDTNTFEVFQGFNQTPLGEGDRFHFLQENGELEYYPCRLVVSFPLDNLPTDDDFVALADPEEEEETSAPETAGV